MLLNHKIIAGSSVLLTACVFYLASSLSLNRVPLPIHLVYTSALVTAAVLFVWGNADIKRVRNQSNATH